VVPWPFERPASENGLRVGSLAKIIKKTHGVRENKRRQ